MRERPFWAVAVQCSTEKSIRGQDDEGRKERRIDKHSEDTETNFERNNIEKVKYPITEKQQVGKVFHWKRTSKTVGRNTVYVVVHVFCTWASRN